MYGYITPPTISETAGRGPSLWLAPLDMAPAQLARLAACVPGHERAHTNRLHRPVDRRRRLAARAWLRQLLGALLAREPGDLVLLRDENRKPALADRELSFSVSHSEGVALLATSWEMQVGVDLEALRPGAPRDLDAVACRFFHPTELEAITSASGPHRAASAVQCWTCKEAYGKALGVGLDFPLREVATWRADGQPVLASGWSVHQVPVGGGRFAAVAGSGLADWAPRPLRQLTVCAMEGLTR